MQKQKFVNRKCETDSECEFPGNQYSSSGRSLKSSSGEVKESLEEGATGMRYFSLAHSPKSMSLHLSEQKGREGFSVEYKAKRPHCGHLTCRAFTGSVISFSYCRRKRSASPES